MKFLLWLILLIVAWPLALVVLAVYAVGWLIAVPFRLLRALVQGVLGLLRAVLRTPGRLVGRSS